MGGGLERQAGVSAMLRRPLPVSSGGLLKNRPGQGGESARGPLTGRPLLFIGSFIESKKGQANRLAFRS